MTPPTFMPISSFSSISYHLYATSRPGLQRAPTSSTPSNSSPSFEGQVRLKPCRPSEALRALSGGIDDSTEDTGLTACTTQFILGRIQVPLHSCFHCRKRFLHPAARPPPAFSANKNGRAWPNFLGCNFSNVFENQQIKLIFIYHLRV